MLRRMSKNVVTFDEEFGFLRYLLNPEKERFEKHTGKWACKYIAFVYGLGDVEIMNWD